MIQSGGTSRSRAVVALVGLVLGSGFAGAAIDRAMLRSDRIVPLYDTTFHPLSSVLRSPTTEDRQQYLAQLSHALALTANQDSAIDRIMSERAGQFSALREDIRPRVDRLVTDVRADIEKVLTGPQRDAFRRLQQRSREQLVSTGQAP